MRTLASRLLVSASALLISTHAALAQDADWVKPGTDLLDALESGLVQIGGPVIGIGIIAIGILGALSGRIEWGKVGYVVLGGLFVMVGPAALRALLGA